MLIKGFSILIDHVFFCIILEFIIELRDIAIIVRSQQNSYHIKRTEKLKHDLVKQAELMDSKVGSKALDFITMTMNVYIVCHTIILLCIYCVCKTVVLMNMTLYGH